MAGKQRFKLFAFWVELYGSFKGVDIPEYEDFTLKQKLHFQNKISALKSQFEYDDKSIRALMLYMLVFDPLKKPIEDYGSIDCMFLSAKYFEKWKRSYRDDIERYSNLPFAIISLAPKTDEQAKELESEEYIEAFQNMFR